MNIAVESFGTLPDGRQALLYILENDGGMRAEITNFGGCLVRLYVPDRAGNSADVVLGHPSLEGYLTNPQYFGALVGRNCNRIAGASLPIAGKVWPLEANDGACNLHSGPKGLSFRLMAGEARIVGNQPVLLLTHTIEDLGDGFPGNLTISVAYALTDNNALSMEYRAVADQSTIINLTNHSYFNLAGHGSGTIHGHQLTMGASYYTPNTPECYPSGEIRLVEGTPFDFTAPRVLGDGMDGDCSQIQLFGGYDHNFLLDGSGYRKAATAVEPESGRVMELYTNLPGVQLYTGNALGETAGKDGAAYRQHSGFCLETQFVPNAVNMPWLMSPIFRPGEEYAATTTFQFGTL